MASVIVHASSGGRNARRTRLSLLPGPVRGEATGHAHSKRNALMGSYLRSLPRRYCAGDPCNEAQQERSCKKNDRVA